jgi:acyl-CoA hydrolase
LAQYLLPTEKNMGHEHGALQTRNSTYHNEWGLSLVENHKLVMPGHLNQFAYLFGGNLLKWVDEHAWISASLDYPECNFVTIGMDKVEFKKSVKEGTILKFITQKTKVGRTSVRYMVEVFRGNKGSVPEDLVFSTHVTFVNIDLDGRKAQLAE